MSILDELDKPKKRKAGLTFNVEGERFAITFDPDISTAEFLEVWTRYDKARKKAIGYSRFRKSSPPKDIDLVLCVNILRQFGASFKQIHEAFVNKKVPYYEGDYRF
jgi:hypothetical protein